MPLLALVGNWWVIPRLGAPGAALVTASLSVLASIVSIGLLYHLWKVAPPIATLLRSLLTSLLIYGIALVWPASGWLIIVKLSALSLAIPITLLVLGEFEKKEIHLLFSLILKPKH